MAKFQGRSERELAAKERQINAWRLTLQNNPDQARQAVSRAMDLISQNNVFDQYDRARYYAQMMNGVAHPGEFGVNDETALAKRA